MLSFVVAIAENNVIGKDKSLAWHLPNDLKIFKEITLSGSKTMIMGRKTFESLPNVLPGRKHIVLTKNRDYKVDDDVKVIHDVDAIMSYVASEEEYFVIGGAEIFKLLLPYTEKMYLTEIHESFEGDTFFPEYDKSEWKVKAKKEYQSDEKNKYRHTFLILERI
jgi:dihydrofolate reductase